MGSRAVALAAAMVVLGACTGGDGTGERGLPAPPTSVSSTLPAAATTTSAAPTDDLPGSVTLRATGLTLPDGGAGGTGLRLLVRAASPRLVVRRRGGGRPVSVCPAADARAPVDRGRCVDLGPDGVVELAVASGLELRATGADVTLDEVGVTYLPADRTTTLVTPARPAGRCSARPCETTYTLRPGRAGSFTLDGRGGGGRPRLVLTSAPAGSGRSGSNRTLATVEGGGSLSIRATVEAGWEATLLHHEQGPDAVASVTAEISWP